MVHQGAFPALPFRLRSPAIESLRASPVSTRIARIRQPATKLIGLRETCNTEMSRWPVSRSTAMSGLFGRRTVGTYSCLGAPSARPARTGFSRSEGQEPTNPMLRIKEREIRNLCLLDFGKRLLGLAFS